MSKTGILIVRLLVVATFIACVVGGVIAVAWLSQPPPLLLLCAVGTLVLLFGLLGAYGVSLKRLRVAGLPVVATLEQVELVIRDDFMLTVRYTLEGRDYSVCTKQRKTDARAPVFNPDQPIPLRVDPTDHERVLVEWERFVT